LESVIFIHVLNTMQVAMNHGSNLGDSGKYTIWPTRVGADGNYRLAHDVFS